MNRVVILALAAAVAQASAQPTIAFEVRAFDGGQEVTAETRLTIYRAGERTDPLAQVSARANRLETTVAPGIYDLQLIQERTGRVLNIRWAERLVVMQYPDEAGHHLEVVNFKPGLGALEIRSKQPGATPDVALYPPGVRDKEAATRIEGPGYALFVVPSGKYDILLRAGGRSTWTTDVDVPLDRTRLWLAPDRVPVAICARSDGGRRARRGSPPE
jgi:hypothetical protein